MGLDALNSAHAPHVLKYLARIYETHGKKHACHADSAEAVERWQAEARPVLRRLIGLEAIAASARGHRPEVRLEQPENLGRFTRRLGWIETEPDVTIPFWLLKPPGKGPFPVAIMPHGHTDRGFDQYAGIAHNEAGRRLVQDEDRDVAVQAAERGFIAIAPTTRGFEPAAVRDLNGRHGKLNCRSQMIHCLLAGRTAIGERVWDMERLLDYALALPEADPRRVLMMGNSGGGGVTTFAAACDTRVTVAVASCSFCTFVGANGVVHLCDCNTVPGILHFGDYYDVAGLIAPRRLMIVHGDKDPLFPLSEIEKAVAGVRAIYKAAGAEDHLLHAFGHGGHRFYKDLMWGFVQKATQNVQLGYALDSTKHNL
jgi:dienelactone hydrolase